MTEPHPNAGAVAGWELRTEHATITTTWGVWEPGPRLQALLDDGWEPFQVFPVPNHGGLSCPLVWLRRPAHLDGPGEHGVMTSQELPVVPGQGDVYHDVSTDTRYRFDGSAWVVDPPQSDGDAERTP